MRRRAAIRRTDSFKGESRAYVEEVLRAGASGYVVKNSASKDVHNAIDAVRSGASYLSPAITQQVVDAIARPGDSGPSGVSMLTEREREVLKLIAEGLSSKEIATGARPSLTRPAGSLRLAGRRLPSHFESIGSRRERYRPVSA